MKPRLSLKGRALQLLAQREQSRVELRRKLMAHAQAAAEPDGYVCDAAGQVDAVLAWLEANEFASDERFAESRVHARAARFGNLRIRSELAQHGVVVGAEQAQQLKESEFERAWQVWQRKFGQAVQVAGADSQAGQPVERQADRQADRQANQQANQQADAAAQMRQSRFLAGRGFSPEIIRQVLRAARSR